MRVDKRGVKLAIGSAMALTAIMATPVFADTSAEVVTNEESILDTAAWADKAAANVSSYANVRQAADVESEQVGVLLPGHGVTVLENDGSWSRIVSGTVEGYVRNDLLVYGEEARVHYMNVCGITGTADTDGLRVREGASEEARILDVLSGGETITVTGSENGWYTVSLEGTPAYVSAQYLSVGDMESVAMTAEEYRQLQEQQAAEEAARAAAEAVSYENAPAAVSGGELDLLAALIQCEAGGESRTGKVAVGAVVMNRVNSGSFPGNITDVVYQSGQFSPVTNGTLSRTLANGARSDCYEAAQAALNGENPVGDALYFNSGYGRGIQIGNQHFY